MIEYKCITNSIFQSVTYFLTDRECKELALVDCGDIAPILDFAQHNKLNLKYIFLTHTHFDHIYGLNEVLKRYPLATIYTSSKGKLGLYNTKLNLSQYSEKFLFRLQYDNVIVLHEGDSFPFAGEHIRILSTPGHDWSCLSYVLGDKLFTGDSYIPGIKVVANWPTSNKIDAKASLQRLMKLESTGLKVCPGHDLNTINYKNCKHDSI